MEYLVIDGYNVINAWSDLFDPSADSLEDCRLKLLDILSNYQGYKKNNIVVVFDAHLVKGSQEKKENYDNLTVIYTKENETADNYIEKFVYNLGNIHTIRVVTADYLEQTMILRKGGIRVLPRELRSELRQAGNNLKVNITNAGAKDNTIMSNLKPELLEKLEKMRRSKF
ncbi:MAG: NYN domain-containing protein [Clostridia bacterium]|nr:NYN domain-containing protein [Clostridia bacterium]